MKSLVYKITNAEGVRFFIDICSKINDLKLDISDYDPRTNGLKDSTVSINVPKELERKLSQFGAIQYGGKNDILKSGKVHPNSPSIAYIELRFYYLALRKLGMEEIVNNFSSYRDDSNEAIRFRFYDLDSSLLEYIGEICNALKHAFQEKYEDIYDKLSISEVPPSVRDMPR